MQLNCDLAELDNGVESAVMPHIDMANIACGLHAGNIDLMQKTIALAHQYQVTIGAHPSYDDRENFGRKSILLSKQQLHSLLHYQLGAIDAMAFAQGAVVDYVKPHGALYNDMMADLEIFTQVVKSLSDYPKSLKLMLLATSQASSYQSIAEQHNIELIFEAFADRLYTDQGKLTPRTQAGAVLNDQQSLAQVELLVNEQRIITASGASIPLQADTICVHGDNEHCLSMIKAIRQLCRSC